MDRYFTKTFIKFLVGFLVIIGAAFTLISLATSQLPQPQPVDNLAQPG